MATKKATVRKTTNSPIKKSPAKRVISSRNSSNGIFDYFRFGESYTSLILGMVVVIIATILLVAFFKNRNINSELNPRQDISATSLTPTQRTYTVKEGDTLWSIAESELNDGYRWKEILIANNLVQATDLERGTKLIIPDTRTAAPGNTEAQEKEQLTVSPTQIPEPTVAPSIAPTARPYFPDQNLPESDQRAKIMGSTYTVKEGDTLWDISQRAYGDPYKWVDISNKNQLPNPDLIFVDAVLQIPR